MEKGKKLNGSAKRKTLREEVRKAMKRYYKSLDQEIPADVYNMVMREVEIPLFISILKFANNNQSKAAKMLGISRGTFRSKLKKYEII